MTYSSWSKIKILGHWLKLWVSSTDCVDERLICNFVIAFSITQFCNESTHFFKILGHWLKLWVSSTDCVDERLICNFVIAFSITRFCNESTHFFFQYSIHKGQKVYGNTAWSRVQTSKEGIHTEIKNTVSLNTTDCNYLSIIYCSHKLLSVLNVPNWNC